MSDIARANPVRAMIELEQVSIRLQDQPIFSDFSLCLDPGEKVVLTGRSGTGKSTLFNALLGFTRIDRGTIRVDGLELGAATVHAIRQRIAWLPQELGFVLHTAGELLDYPYTFRKNRDLRPDPARIRAMLERLDLPKDILQKRLFEISGGQKQRLLAASLLLMNRPVLLMDEPTAALDRHSAERLLAEVTALQETTVLAATHDPSWMEGLDRAVSLEVST